MRKAEYRVGFLGRGRLGARVLAGLLADPELAVPVILTCRETPEVASESGSIEMLARDCGADYAEVSNINHQQWVDRLREHNLNLAVAMLWLHTIDSDILGTARQGFINCHGGSLPKYRGNACANWAILNNEEEMGITVHLMEAGTLDSGPIILQQSVPIQASTTIGELTVAFESIGAELTLKAVALGRAGKLHTSDQLWQDSSFCYPRLPRDGEIDWTRPGIEVNRLIRAAGRPYPGAYSFFSDFRDSNRIKKLTIWQAHVVPPPYPSIFAVPGHVIRLDKGKTWGVVCGDRSVLVLDNVSLDDREVKPGQVFRTVRQRLGLDVQTHLANLESRVQACEQALRLGR